MGCVSSRNLRGGSVSARIPQPVGRHVLKDENQKLGSSVNHDDRGSSCKSMPDTAAYSDLTSLIDSSPNDAAPKLDDFVDAGEYLEPPTAEDGGDSSAPGTAVAVKCSLQGTETAPLDDLSVSNTVASLSLSNVVRTCNREKSTAATSGVPEVPAVP